MVWMHEPTKEYPVTESVIKQRYPQISFTDNFAPPEGEGYVLVHETIKPEINPDIEKLAENDPEWVIDKWVQRLNIISLSNEERAVRLQEKRATVTTPLFNGKAALLLRGDLDAVQAILDRPDTNPLYKLAFNAIPVWRRLSPAILWMQEQMNWTDGYVDALFEQANTIEID